MPFHDASGPVDEGYRGSHLYAWDIADERLVDMSASQPAGVLQERSGIMALDLHRQSDRILGLSVPRGDLLFYDAHTGVLDWVVPGPEEELWKQLPRNLVCAPDGRVFFAFGHTESVVYRYDPESGSVRKTGATTNGGFWNGSALMPDGKGAYISTARGELFQIDFESEGITPLGHFLPEDELAAGDHITQLFCLALSADGHKLYAVPTAISTRLQSLYEYDLASGRVEKLVDTKAMGLFGMTFTGSAVRDSRGRIYFAAHYYGRQAFILQLDVSGRLQGASVVQGQGASVVQEQGAGK
jgi:sugar lactone lactonase YvrE